MFAESSDPAMLEMHVGLIWLVTDDMVKKQVKECQANSVQHKLNIPVCTWPNYEKKQVFGWSEEALCIWK